MENELRWKQRFQNFNKAFDQLQIFLSQKDLNKLEEQGLIKAFEYTYELAWKTLQDVLKNNGYTDVMGPKPVIKQSFQDGYLSDGQAWLRMQKSRNLTSHTYNQETANEILADIKGEFNVLLTELKERLTQELSK